MKHPAPLLFDRAQKASGPGDLLTTVLDPIMKLQQKRSELEMESFAKNHQKLFDEMLKTMRDNGKEEEANLDFRFRMHAEVDGTLGSAEGRLVLYRPVVSIERSISTYASWLNEHRPHQGLGQRTPDEVHQGTPTRARSVPLRAVLDAQALEGDLALPVRGPPLRMAARRARARPQSSAREDAELAPRGWRLARARAPATPP